MRRLLKGSFYTVGKVSRENQKTKGEAVAVGCCVGWFPLHPCYSIVLSNSPANSLSWLSLFVVCFQVCP